MRTVNDALTELWEGEAADVDGLQRRVVRANEGSLQSVKSFFRLFEAVSSNGDAFQAIHVLKDDAFRVFEGIVANGQCSQVCKATERDFLQVRLVAAIGAESELFDAVVKELACSGEQHGGLQTIVIHPLSVKHRLLVPVVLRPSSPALSVTDLALIFLLSNIRIEAPPVTRIDISHSESLIHFVVICIIEYSTTAWLFSKNIAFPSISLVTEV